MDPKTRQDSAKPSEGTTESRAHRDWLGRTKDVPLITDAQLAPGQDRRRREIIYSILQFVRVPSLILAFYLIYVHSAWILAALVVGVTIPLPYLAVVIANGKGQAKDKRERNVYKPAVARQLAAQQMAVQLQATQAQAIDAPPKIETIDNDTGSFVEDDIDPDSDHTQG